MSVVESNERSPRPGTNKHGSLEDAAVAAASFWRLFILDSEWLTRDEKQGICPVNRIGQYQTSKNLVSRPMFIIGQKMIKATCTTKTVILPKVSKLGKCGMIQNHTNSLVSLALCIWLSIQWYVTATKALHEMIGGKPSDASIVWKFHAPFFARSNLLTVRIK